MNELMQEIMKEKAKNRKRLAGLPFGEKLSIMEKLRDRAIAIANSPLRRFQPRPSVVVSVNGNVVQLSDVNINVLRRPVVHQFEGQPTFARSSMLKRFIISN